jgi:type II secretory pathway pseudopilin PulG
MELTLVLIVIAILSAVIFTRSPSLDTALPSRVSELRAQIRHIQLRAMKNGSDYCGVKCDGNYYWAFNSTSPDAAASFIALPGESAKQIPLSPKDISAMTSFTLYFDTFGIPYSGNSPTKLASPLSITITVHGASQTLTVAPETGFVP